MSSVPLSRAPAAPTDTIVPEPNRTAPGKAGGRPLRFVTREALFQALQGSVEEALRERGIASDVILRARRGVVRHFTDRVRRGSKRVRGMTRTEFMAELADSRGEFQAQEGRARSELTDIDRALLQARTELFRQRPESEALARALRSDLEAFLAAGAPDVELAALLERDRVRRETAQAETYRTIDVLERRVTKMRSELTDLETRYAELARRATEDHGLPSIYRTVQGLEAGEDQEQRRSCLQSIFEQNLVLQKKSG